MFDSLYPISHQHLKSSKLVNIMLIWYCRYTHPFSTLVQRRDTHRWLIPGTTLNTRYIWRLQLVLWFYKYCMQFLYCCLLSVTIKYTLPGVRSRQELFLTGEELFAKKIFYIKYPCFWWLIPIHSYLFNFIWSIKGYIYVWVHTNDRLETWKH